MIEVADTDVPASPLILTHAEFMIGVSARGFTIDRGDAMMEWYHPAIGLAGRIWIWRNGVVAPLIPIHFAPEFRVIALWWAKQGVSH